MYIYIYISIYICIYLYIYIYVYIMGNKSAILTSLLEQFGIVANLYSTSKTTLFIALTNYSRGFRKPPSAVFLVRQDKDATYTFTYIEIPMKHVYQVHVCRATLRYVRRYYYICMYTYIYICLYQVRLCIDIFA